MLKIIFFIASLFYLLTLSSMAQPSAISGCFEVFDTISNTDTIDIDSINDSIFNQDGLAIWEVKTEKNYPFLSDVKFYAKLDKNTGNLFILLSSDEESTSLRGMIPSLFDDENYALSTEPDEFHKCYKYTNRNTLIYSILIDVFEDLKENSVISKGSTLSKNPSYKCSFSNKLFIKGYYISAAEYDSNYNCFHNWPWGSGTDTCKYNPEFHGCEYSDGWVNVDFNLDTKGIKNYYIYGGVYNDNREESSISLDDTLWLQQRNWGGKSDIKYGKNDFPSKITLYGQKTWSVISAFTWMAIDADSMDVTGFITGDGPTKVDDIETPDVFEAIDLKNEPIEWPTAPVSNIKNNQSELSSRVAPENHRATVIDSSINHTNINNFTMSYYGSIYTQYDTPTGMSGWHDYEDILIKRGDSEYTIPFEKIKEINFDWNIEPPSVEIILVDGEKINGETLRTNSSHDWYFRGQTIYSYFELELEKTTKIIFDKKNIVNPQSVDNEYYGTNNIMNVKNIYNYITNNALNLGITFSVFALGATLLSFVFRRDNSKKSKPKQ